MSRALARFNGGVHPPAHKAESTTRPVIAAPLPKRLLLPLHQHIGEPAEPAVTIGERVYKGQLIAHASGFISAPVHAPTSGTVVEINNYAVPHPSGLAAPCVVIEPDGEDHWGALSPIGDYTQVNDSHLRNVIREAGIVGLGGAGFPSFIKLNPGPDRAVDLLILNGVECEPYITCDDMLMRTRPADIIAGAIIMRHALRARECVIAIEDNKPEAFGVLSEAIRGQTGFEVIQVPTIYPAGSEKQLIKVLTGKEVPSSGLALHIGVVCHNVGTAVAVYEAIQYGRPLISRYVTVTGNGVSEPRVLDVLIGTPIRELIEFCGADPAQVRRLVMGGPMMGYALHTDLAPVVKTTNCIIAATTDVAPEAPALPCIRCGACADVCPVNLLPQQLYWYAKAKDFEKTQEYKLFDCIECGCCSYVCPSNIPLVQYYRYAKGELWTREREKEKSDRARGRHESRQQRLEREKLERELRSKKKKAALGKAPGADEAEAKKASILAAVERARAKRQTNKVAPRNIENLSEEQRRKIAEVDARREATRKQQPEEPRH